MPKNIHVRIDAPCSESWDQMHPKEQGRFCDSCQKTVIDFSNMSDQEVLSWLSRTNKSVCGRFHIDQLDRNLLPPAGKRGHWSAFWQLLLAGLLVSSEASAQSPAARQEIVERNNGTALQGDVVIVGKVAQSPSKPGFIIGRVIDSATGQPLAGASIQLERSAKSFPTDKDGCFRIERKLAEKYHTLNITRIGYAPLAIPIGKNWPDYVEKSIPMSISPVVLPAVTVVGYGSTTVRVRLGGAISIIKKDSFAQKIKDTLAIVGLTKKALTIYPNPVARGASITLALRPDNSGVYTAQLFSVSGALIETIQIEGNTPTVLMHVPATLAAGVYFVKLSHPFMNKVYTRQLLVL